MSDQKNNMTQSQAALQEYQALSRNKLRRLGLPEPGDRVVKMESGLSSTLGHVMRSDDTLPDGGELRFFLVRMKPEGAQGQEAWPTKVPLLLRTSACTRLYEQALRFGEQNVEIAIESGAIDKRWPVQLPAYTLAKESVTVSAAELLRDAEVRNWRAAGREVGPAYILRAPFTAEQVQGLRESIVPTLDAMGRVEDHNRTSSGYFIVVEDGDRQLPLRDWLAEYDRKRLTASAIIAESDPKLPIPEDFDPFVEGPYHPERVPGTDKFRVLGKHGRALTKHDFDEKSAGMAVELLNQQPQAPDPFEGRGRIVVGDDGEEVRVLESEGRCDFCESRGPVWEYPADTFTMNSPTGSPYTSDGPFAACGECGELIERNDYDGLVRRHTMQKPPRLRQVVNFYARQLFEQFRTHRTGPRYPAPKRPQGAKAEQKRLADAQSRLDGQFARQFAQKRGPAREPRLHEAQCDFDLGTPIVWRYPATSFDFEPDGSNVPLGIPVEPWHSEGDWAACDSCSRLIERAGWDKLANRNLRARMQEGRDLHETSQELPSQLKNRLQEWAHRQAVRMFVEFARHRTGPRKPVFPEAHMRVPEISHVAQVAFGEQLKLLRWARSEEARRYVGGWMDANLGDPEPAVLRRATDTEMLSLLVPLRFGETFFWARETCGMIRESSHLLNRETPWTLLRENLPAPNGFFYCDAPVGESADHPLRAVAWTLAERIHNEPVWSADAAHVTVNVHGRANIQTAIGVVVVWFSEAPKDSDHAGALRPSGFTFWEFGRDHVWSAHANDLGASVDNDRLAALATMFAFMSQHILVASRPFTPDRPTRKQAERERPEHEPVLRVVELRKRKYVGREADPDHQPREIDWQSRWWVSPHTRMQCFDVRHHKDGTCLHQAVFIAPFVKGPADKPLKAPPTTVFAVVR